MKCNFAKLIAMCMVMMLVLLPIMGSTGVIAYASLEDDLSSGSESISSGEGIMSGEISEDDAGVVDYFKNHRAMTDEQLDTASKTIAPLTNVIGYLIGAIVAITGVLVFLITAIDLLYIAVPPVRRFLYDPNTDGTGAMTGGRMGGMGGYGMRGGYGMGGMGAMGGAQGGAATRKRQWVSDEAVQCAALMGGSAATEGMGAMGGMGGYGMGMNSMGGAQANPGDATTKSVIKTYLFKRMFFLILFAICTVVLTSSVLLGTGANLAQWFLKIIGAANEYIPK